jgi:hypothetical protein
VEQLFGVVGIDNAVCTDVPENDTIIHFELTQYSLKQAFKRFPVEAKNYNDSRKQQLHDMQVFKPVHKDQLT